MVDDHAEWERNRKTYLRLAREGALAVPKGAWVAISGDALIAQGRSFDDVDAKVHKMNLPVDSEPYFVCHQGEPPVVRVGGGAPKFGAASYRAVGQ